MSSTSKTAINESISAGLDERCKQWLAIARSTKKIDKLAVEEAVSAVYRVADPECTAPMIVWCDSPWQAVVMASALQTGYTRAHASRRMTFDPGHVASREQWPEKLWEKLWGQIDRQGGEELRSRFKQARPKKPEKDNSPFGWFASIGQKKDPEVAQREARASLPSWIMLQNFSITEVLSRLTKELHGACAIRLADDGGFAELKQTFETQLTRRFNENPTLQLRNQMMLLSTIGLNANFSGLLSVENLLKLGFEAVRGNVQEEFDKLYAPEDRTQFSFGMTAVTTSSALTHMPAVGWLPFYEYLAEQLPWLPIGPSNKKRMHCFMDLARQVQYCLFLEGVCFVCERPNVMECDDNGRLHCETGPALVYKDGFELYSWHGTTVPKSVIMSPQSLTAALIISEMNAEVRRVMIERFGLEQFIIASGAQVNHKDDCGVLYKKELMQDEPLVMVKVVNSTPEPDGTYKSYFLRVPPTITTAREAVAWTFDMKPEEYSPKRQT